MDSKQRVKIFQRALARYGLLGTNQLLVRLPYPLVRFLTHILVAIGYRLTIKQRRMAKESLQIAFGSEKSPQEINRITKQCFENIGQGMTEMLYFMAHPGLLDKKVSWQGRAHLDEALKKGNGVIAVTAHFGNFPLMMLTCAHQGYPCHCVIRPTRDQELEKFLLKKRTEARLNTVYAIPRKQCVEQSIKVLRKNEVLFIPLDQNFGSGGGVFVDFFGQKAATATGPVVFALRTKAPILPMFIIRESDDRHKIIIEPPLEIETKGDERETIEFNIIKLTGLIERYIRKYPHEWGWMHRRWKSRPSFEPAAVSDALI